MDPHTIRIASLCSGVGLLDIGLHEGLRFLGFNARTVVYCERDSYAQAVLLARMEDSSLEQAAICDDLADIDERWLGAIDCIVSGFPCQPWSAAGKQKGTDDERWLWPQIARIIRNTKPEMVFLENVPGLISGGGLHFVLDDLAEMGFDAEWGSITAESVGASHRRERVFVLAYHTVTRSRKVSEPEGRDDATDAYRGRGVSRADSYVSSMRRALQGVERNGQSMPKLQDGKYSISLAFSAERGQRELRQSSERDGFFDGRDEAMEQSNGSSGRLDKQGRGSHRRTVAGRTSGDVADADEQGPQKRIGEQRNEREEFATAERGGSIFAPGPGADWRNVPAHLWPAVESGLRFVADGLSVVVDASRADQLRCAGNAVVPLQAAVAFVELMRRAEVTT